MITVYRRMGLQPSHQSYKEHSDVDIGFKKMSREDWRHRDESKLWYITNSYELMSILKGTDRVTRSIAIFWPRFLMFSFTKQIHRYLLPCSCNHSKVCFLMLICIQSVIFHIRLLPDPYWVCSKTTKKSKKGTVPLSGVDSVLHHDDRISRP